MSNIPISERINWIGASESAGLLGVSPFTTPYQLYCEKKGIIERDSLDDNERVMAGQFLEPAIAAWAGHKWGWPISNVEAYERHPRIERMGASLDFETADGEPVEIKNVDYLIFRDHWAADGDTILDAPIHYLIQVQHQMACRPGIPRGWLVACVGGNTLYRMEIQRHERTIAMIENAVTEFWRRVEAEQPPRPDFAADAATIAAIHNSGGQNILDLSQNNRLPELCETVIREKAVAKAASNNVEAALAEIKHTIGTAGGAICAGGYQVKAINVKESVVEAHTRAPYRRWNVVKSEGATR